MSCVLALLLRLRQACVHLSLTRNAVDIGAFKQEGVDEPDAHDMAELEKTFSNICLEAAPDGNAVDIEKLFLPSFLSAKIRAVLEHLQRVVAAGEKCVVVSQWTSVLDIIRAHLAEQRIATIGITGSVLPKDRQAVMDDFNSAKGKAQVMLLSLTAGGVGLNLVGGNHLFLVDLHWNPALENQAFDRIYRMGQTKQVFVKKFVCRGTIEERVVELQDKKLALAQSVLDGVASKKLKALSMNDLKFLFDLDKRS